MTPQPRNADDDDKTGRIARKRVKRGRLPDAPEPSLPVGEPRVIHPRRKKPPLPEGDAVEDATPSAPAPLDDEPRPRTRKPEP